MLNRWLLRPLSPNNLQLIPSHSLLLCFRRSTGDIENNTECVFYILGTAHVSRKSCDDAATLINLVKPELVLVELCNERQAILTLEKRTEQIPLSAILTEIRTGRTSAFQGIYSWLLARVGNDLDISPGEEFRVAVKEAQKIGACVVLGDRPLSITLSRLWSALSLWEKCRLLGTLLWTGVNMLDSEEMRSEIEKLKDSDVLTEAIKEVGKDFPSLLGPLITERDQYMTYIMQELAGKATQVVAVVGAGHLEGIKKHWDSEIDIESICRIPPKKRRIQKGVLLLGFAATGMAVVFGVSRWRQRRS
ncbi:hypothetical protein Ndes2526B_g04753 [Nannochloris sp. 'desiccata']